MTIEAIIIAVLITVAIHAFKIQRGGRKADNIAQPVIENPMNKVNRWRAS